MKRFAYNKEEKEYLKIVHKSKEEHHLQTKIFSLQPMAVKFDLFTGHCEMCQQKLHSRPLYLLKIPNNDITQIRYFCGYCAGLHQKYIIGLIITKN